MIGDGKLAARELGAERRENMTDTECPICFLHYTAINMTKCCQAYVCTECYLQVRPQKLPTLRNGKTASGCPCPFCNATNIRVEPAVSLSLEEINKRNQEENRIREAQNRIRENQLNGFMNEALLNRMAQAIPALDDDIPTQSPTPTNPLSRSASGNLRPPFQIPTPLVPSEDTHNYQQQRIQTSIPSPPAFGSLLEQDPRSAASRYRDRDLIDDSSSNRAQLPRHDTNYHQNPSQNIVYDRPRTPEISISEMAMSPAERYALEQEMRRQGKHPLSIRLNAEEAERRLRNDLRRMEMQRDSAPVGQRDYRESRDWNQRTVPARNNNDVTSFDEMVVLEAAIMLSMQEEEARQRAAAISTEKEQQLQQTAVDYPNNMESKVAAIRAPLAVEDSVVPQRSGNALSEDEQFRLAIKASLKQGKNDVRSNDTESQFAISSVGASFDYEKIDTPKLQRKGSRDLRSQDALEASINPSKSNTVKEYTPPLPINEQQGLLDPASYGQSMSNQNPLIGNNAKSGFHPSHAHASGQQHNEVSIGYDNIVEISLIPQNSSDSYQRTESSADSERPPQIGNSNETSLPQSASHPSYNQKHGPPDLAPTFGRGGSSDDDNRKLPPRPPLPSIKSQERATPDYPASFIRMYPDYEDSINAPQDIDAFPSQPMKRPPNTTEILDADMDSKPAARSTTLKAVTPSPSTPPNSLPRPGVLVSEFTGARRKNTISGNFQREVIEEEKCAITDDALFDDSSHV